MSDEKDEDDKPTRDEIIGRIYEYGLYILLGIVTGLVANMAIRAILI